MRKKNSMPGKGASEVSRKTAAFFWDESFLWGVMAYRSLQRAYLPFELVRSDDIRDGCLSKHSFLFVPGGWSSNKLKALGEKGSEEIRNFVCNGGGYLGFCGGAGLALNDGIGLLNIRRKPTRERVPSFSGRIRLKTSKHSAWKAVDESVFHAWWPPQFDGCDENVKVLARYDRAFDDSFSSDLNVGDVRSAGDWKMLEGLYRINLDPGRLLGEPAVIEGKAGKGKVILSLVHFDTPGDENGSMVLRNLWEYLSPRVILMDCSFQDKTSDRDGLALACQLGTAARDLIEFGLRNFLWFRKNPFLLQWRRGVRGLEYCTLHVMVREIAGCLEYTGLPGIDSELKALRKILLPFLREARALLMMERIALHKGHITYDRCDDPRIGKMRESLFSSSKSYGGRFKEVLDMIDNILYRLLKAEVY